MSLGADGLYSASRPTEYTYHLATSNAFKTVNAAVFITLSRYSGTRPVVRDEIDGATAYLLHADSVQAQLFVAHITDRVASIRLHYRVPIDPIQFIVWRNSPRPKIAFEVFDSLFAGCHEEIIKMLRHAALVEEHAPPAPPKNHFADIFTWQAIYYPDMPDDELADTIGVSYQTLRNKRSKLGHLKRTARGKKRRN